VHVKPYQQTYYIILYHIYTHPIACYRSPWLPIAPGLPPPESAVSPHCRSPAVTGAAPVVGLRNASGGGGLLGKMYGKTIRKPWKKHGKTIGNHGKPMGKPKENIGKNHGSKISKDFILGILDHHIIFVFWALSMIFLC
jgi:hypothetical protein